MKNTKHLFVLCPAALAAVLSARWASGAVFTATSPEEAMVLSGAPTTIWDPKGATEISSNGLNTMYPGNTEYALMDFNAASIVSQANTAYGVGNWTIAGVGLTLYSNFATAGQIPNNAVFNEIEAGSFNINWMSNNGWTGDQVTWNNLPNYLPSSNPANLEEAEGTFSFLANGTSPNSWSLTPTADLLSDLDSGGTVSFLGTPGDSNVGFLFNTPLQSNPAVLDVTIQPDAIPEPGSCAILGVCLGATAVLARRRRPIRVS